MKKIIEYLKTFGEDFSKHIEDFRSKVYGSDVGRNACFSWISKDLWL